MITTDLYNVYLSSLLKGDRLHCKEMVQQLLGNKIDIKELYLDLFQTSMYEVGRLWEINKVSVSTEHLATMITESMLNLVYPLLFQKDSFGQTAVIACVTNEYHQLGGKMVADLMELHGWDVYFLGANTSYEDLTALIEKKNPQFVGISVCMHTNIFNTIEIINKLHKQYPLLPIIVGGQAFMTIGEAFVKQYPYVTHIKTVDDLIQYINTQ